MSCSWKWALDTIWFCERKCDNVYSHKEENNFILSEKCGILLPVYSMFFSDYSNLLVFKIFLLFSCSQ